MTSLFAAAPPIPLHALAALLALLIGALQLGLAKGTMLHRWLGRLWVGLMVLVALSSFFIHELEIWGLYSPIHLLSIWTLLALCWGVWLARKGQITAHKRVMVSFYGLGLVLTGLFTLTPGRVMHNVLFG